MAIRSFRHKGLKAFFEMDRTRGIPADQAKRLRRVLSALDTGATLDQMKAFPGWRLHPLAGDLKGYWSVSITGNWRLIFRFKDGDAHDLDLVDYH
ncbi:MAG: type II toxin-antitoxin system RelE/ParE family toxin [Hyphomicrobiaceae bacterium]|jgi:proteic killer suppression protein